MAGIANYLKTSKQERADFAMRTDSYASEKSKYERAIAELNQQQSGMVETGNSFQLGKKFLAIGSASSRAIIPLP